MYGTRAMAEKLSLSSDGVGPIKAAISLDRATLIKLFPGYDVRETTWLKDDQPTRGAFLVLKGKKTLLSLRPWGDGGVRVAAMNPDVATPLVRVGTRHAELEKAAGKKLHCTEGQDEQSDDVVCGVDGIANVEFLYAKPGATIPTSGALQVGAASLESWVLAEVAWKKLPAPAEPEKK